MLLMTSYGDPPSSLPRLPIGAASHLNQFIRAGSKKLEPVYSIGVENCDDVTQARMSALTFRSPVAAGLLPPKVERPVLPRRCGQRTGRLPPLRDV